MTVDEKLLRILLIHEKSEWADIVTRYKNGEEFEVPNIADWDEDEWQKNYECRIFFSDVYFSNGVEVNPVAQALQNGHTIREVLDAFPELNNVPEELRWIAEIVNRHMTKEANGGCCNDCSCL